MTTSNTLRERITLSERIPLRLPLMVYLESTNLCNFSCPFCPTGGKLQRKAGVTMSHIPQATFDKIRKDLIEWTTRVGEKIKTMGLFWMGEPLMNPRLVEMHRSLADANVAENLILSSNGSLLSGDRQDALLESGLNILSISFYGTSDEEYKLVHKNFSFSQVVENVRSFKEKRDRLGRTTPVIVGKFFEVKEDLEDLMVNKLKAVDRVAIESPFNWSADYSEHAGNVVQIARPGPMQCCPSPWFVMSIGSDGSVGGCCSDWAHKANFGNVNESSLYEIWNSDRLLEFRCNILEGRQEDNEACKGCTYYKVSHDPETNLDAFFREFPEKALTAPW